jgi:hypothetical protein
MMRFGSLALLLLVAATSPARAIEVDPPSRVARLSYMEGQVTLQAPNASAPEQAAVNLPLTIGDRLSTDSGSRAELSVGTAALRLDEYTDITVSNLDTDIAQVALNSGTLGIHVRELLASETFEVDTPNATVRLLRPGDYRIGIDQDGTAVVAVRSGDAEVDNGNGPVRVRDGQQLRLAGGDQYANVQNLDSQDAFDDWCIERERAITDAESSRYVSRDVVGYEDLDHYGNWYNEPGYGTVWAPSMVGVGWAPYSFGSWTWIGPWGWTWVDRAPWGFAPFHYGRWAFVHQRWCWVPGPRIHHPVWAPGLVAWRNGSGSVDHTRPVGWFPLGPHEVYVPSKQVSARYLRNVNISNTAIANNAYITNVYNNRVRDIRFANRNVPGALTTAPRSVFTNPRPIAQPVWTGDFRNNARLERGPTQRVPAPRPVGDEASRPNRGMDSRGRDEHVAEIGTPAAFGRPQDNTPPQDRGGHVSIPRLPGDRRQIQSDDGWRRIDARPNALQPTLQGAPLPRFDANRSERATNERAAPVPRQSGGGGHENRENRASAPVMRAPPVSHSTPAPSHEARPSGGGSRGAASMGGGHSNRGGASPNRL